MKEIQIFYNNPISIPPSYRDGQNMFYEYAVFLNRRDGIFHPPAIDVVPLEMENTSWNNWLKQIHAYFQKEIPDISMWDILGILKNPKTIDVVYEIMSIAPFELLKEFKTYISKIITLMPYPLPPPLSPLPPPPDPFHHPHNTPINQIISTIKNAPLYQPIQIIPSPLIQKLTNSNNYLGI